MAASVSTRARKVRTLTETTKDKTAPDETIKNGKAGGSAAHNKRGQHPVRKTKPKKQPGKRGAQTDRTEPNSHLKQKTTVSEDCIVQQENTRTPVETTHTWGVQCSAVHSPSTCHALCKDHGRDRHRPAPEGGWLQHLITKYSQKEFSSKRKNKNKTSSTSSKRKHGKSTWAMRKHHHATFAHLIHDAFIRLKCNPNYNHGGFSKRAIAKNIEKHYRVQLGAKFKARLKLSFDNLVAKRKLVAHGKQRWGIKYTPTPAFLKQFVRLKVIDGAYNSAHGVGIRQSSRSRSSSRSSSRGSSSNSAHGVGIRQSSRSKSSSRSSSRGSSRGSSRSSTRSSRGMGRRRRGRRRHRSQHICGSSHWRCGHIPPDPQQFGESSNMTDEYSSKASSPAASEHGGDAGMGGSWASLFWSKKKSPDGETGVIPEPSAPPEEILESNKRIREEDIPEANQEVLESNKRKREGNSGPRGVGIRRFKKRIKVSYPSSRSSSPERSREQSPGRSSGSSSPERSPQQSPGRYPVINSRWKTIDEGTVGGQEEPFIGFPPSSSSSEQGSDDRNDYHETIYKEENTAASSGSHHSSASKGSRQKKEHDLLHNMKSSSQTAPDRRSWFSRLGDALSFRSDSSEIMSGSERTSTTLANQAGTSGCRGPSKIGPESSKRRVKKVMSKRHYEISLPDAGTIDKEESLSPRHPEVFCSPELASLLQE